MKRLQVLIDNNWEYVFCRNKALSEPVITKDRVIAIKAHKHSLAYFTSNFASYNFRYEG